MEVRLRQRIIGGVVLTALAIIFLPLLFKNSDNSSSEARPEILAAHIPPAPAKPVLIPQTIVMIKNKDLTTPDTAQPVAMLANNIKPATSTVTTPVAATLAAKPALIDNTELNNNNLQNAHHAPTATNSAQLNSTTEKNINAVENQTLSLTGADKNSTDNHVIAAKISTPLPESVPTTTASMPSKSAQTTHDLTTTSASKYSTTVHAARSSATEKKTIIKKHQEINHPAKTTEATHKNTAVTIPEKTIANASKATYNAANVAQTIKVPAGIAWEVRLGSFANISNAKDLVTQLRQYGFKAYTQPVQTSLGTLTRVSIGPEVKRDKANVIQSRLIKDLNIKSEVVPFNPVTDK